MRNGRREPISILHRRLEKPLLALQAAIDGEALIKAVFHLIKSATRCDFVNVCLRIVRKEGGNIAYQMIDSRGREFGLDLLENVFFREHPAMPTLLANPGIKFINTREIPAPDATLHRTRFYREVMQVMGFRHAIGIFFWDEPPHTPEAIFSLCRGEGQPDFTDAEVAVLAGSIPTSTPHCAASARSHGNGQRARDFARSLGERRPQPACWIGNWASPAPSAPRVKAARNGTSARLARDSNLRPFVYLPLCAKPAPNSRRSGAPRSGRIRSPARSSGAECNTRRDLPCAQPCRCTCDVDEIRLWVPKELDGLDTRQPV